MIRHAKATNYWQRLGHAVLVAGMLMVTAVNLPAQALYGSLVGNVVDETGAVVPGATVTITQKETNQTREQATPENGAYSFPNLAARHLRRRRDAARLQDILQLATSPSTSAPSSASMRGSRSGTLEESVVVTRRGGDPAGRQRRAAVGDDGRGARRTSRSTVAAIRAC